MTRVLRKVIIGCATMVALSSCAKQVPVEATAEQQKQSVELKKILSPGAKVLAVAHRMAVVDKEILRGGCWDYINTVYNRAGFPSKKRQRIMHNKRNKGPYAKASQIQPGDWLYFINHSYKGVGHSGIFVSWVDKAKRRAKILSYGGENRKKPGRYKTYTISHVYGIMRPK